MAIDHERVESIFNAALALGSAAEREGYLDSACGQDADLRQRVEALLAAHDGSDSFLAHPLDAAGVRTVGHASAPLAEGAGARIGRYKLLQLIGEGGFGSVFMAEQEHPVRRKVALKIIKLGMDTKQVIARFEAERQALALMDHPNIARVLDAGATDTGRPYFVMELVKGVAITKYCDEHRLTPRDRLGLFIQVCQAVQHAHQKGIIHRDLKPSNVLVALYDGKPLPKVIDFGVAKATGQRLTEQTLFTGFGTVVGTPEYMSPEQAELNQLDVDTRSDIYSLGVLLYELLTGTTPLDRGRFKEAAVLEILRLVREEEPPKPSTRLSTMDQLPSIAAQRSLEPRKLTGVVRGELDWIVMKALEKDRNRRYETANGLAADVQRYLNDEPVAACPPSATYRLKKLARRNKGGLAAAALVLLFLVLVGSGIGWTVRGRAVRHARLAAQVESILTEVDRLEREQSWPEVLAAARRAEASVLGGDADAATAQRVRNRLKDAEWIDRLEQIRMRRAVWVEGSWDFAGADREYARAFREHGVDIDRLAVEASIDRLKSRPELATTLAATLDLWSHARRRAMRGDAADWQRLVVVARGIDPHPLWDRMAAWQKPGSQVQDELRRLAESIDIRTQHPATLDRLAVSLKEAGQPGPALRLLRDARDLYPGDFWLNFELAYFLSEWKDHEGAVRFYTAAISIRPNAVALHSNIAVALLNRGKLDEAVAACRKAIELDPGFPYGYATLSSALMRQKKLDEALAASRKALELDPTNAAIHSNLGNVLKKHNKLDEAVACYRRAIELNANSAIAYSNLGFALSDQGKLDAAVVACRKAIELDPKHANAYHSLGVALQKQGKLDAAIAACRKAIELDPKSAAAYGDLGSALSDQGKLDEAIAAHRKAIELDPGIAAVYHNLGVALDAQKKLDEAIVCYRKAIELDPKFLHPYVNLGNALRVQKKLDEALVCHRKAIELDPNSAIAYTNLGGSLLALKDYGGCVAAFRRVIELDPKFPAAYTRLGTVLYYQNKLDEAVAAYRKAIELDPKDAIAYNNLGEAFGHQGKLDEAITAYKTAIAIDRQSPHAYSGLGWLLATCPDGTFRDPRQALALARKAVELAPTIPDGHRTLGAACYRTGDWNAAIAALEKSTELRGGGDSLDWFFLAMAHRQSGNEDEAQRWYDRAVEGMQTNTPADDELIRLRAEAVGLLRGK